MRWFPRRRHTKASPPAAETLLSVLDLNGVLSEHMQALAPESRKVAGALDGQRVDAVSFDERTSSLWLRCGDVEHVLAIGDGQPASQVEAMVSLETVHVTAVAAGGWVMLEFWSRSWTYSLVTTPAVAV
jgi:hypothetical protein